MTWEEIVLEMTVDIPRLETRARALADARKNTTDLQGFLAAARAFQEACDDATILALIERVRELEARWKDHRCQSWGCGG